MVGEGHEAYTLNNIREYINLYKHRLTPKLHIKSWFFSLWGILSNF